MSRRKPRLLLHIGTHKTGTTAIQHALTLDRAELAAAGIYYPDPYRFGGGRHDAHHTLAHALAGHEAVNAMDLDGFKAHLRDMGAAHRLIVLSAEPFCRHVPELDETVPGSATHQTGHLAFVSRVARYFSDFETEILIYFRRPDGYAESLFKEMMCKTRYAKDFDRFLGDYADRFDYPRLIAIWETYFSKVTTKSYENSRREDLIKTFFRFLVADAPQPRKAHWVRQAPGNLVASWILRAKQQQKRSVKSILRRWLFALQDETQELFREDAPSSLWTSIARRDAFLTEHSASLFDGFFDPPSQSLPPNACWHDDQHDRAEEIFAIWSARNTDYLALREAANLLPFMPDDEMLAALKNTLGAQQRHE